MRTHLTYGNETIPTETGVQDVFDDGEIQMLSAWFQIRGWLHMKWKKEEPSRLGEGEGEDEEDDEQEHPAEEPRRGNDWQRTVLRYQTVKVPENNG